MATNLRLSAAAEQALRETSTRTGRSQQEIIRAAVDDALGLGSDTATPDDLRRMELARRGLTPARHAFHEIAHPVALPDDVDVEALLDRDERLR